MQAGQTLWKKEKIQSLSFLISIESTAEHRIGWPGLRIPAAADISGFKSFRKNPTRLAFLKAIPGQPVTGMKKTQDHRGALKSWDNPDFYYLEASD
ncbi:MAG: hypothetical protein D3910_24410, partial [Candidatus Electrothrix sp. ATG2]|nr:hypothetical protein [Candidatus Electrothrix sp. ATG2]